MACCQVAIDGLLDHPGSLGMNELLGLDEPVTVTAYVACTGNRRKELRALKPVQGSDLGRTAVGNSQWTGGRLTCSAITGRGFKS